MGGRTGPKTAEGKQRALANLLPFRNGQVQSSAFAALPAEVITAKAAEIQAILDGEARGWLRPSDGVAVSLLARVLTRLEAIDQTEAVDRWLRGQTAGRARVSMRVPGFVVVYQRLIEQAAKLANDLGLTPIARKRLGIAALSEATTLETIRARYAPPVASDRPTEDSS